MIEILKIVEIQSLNVFVRQLGKKKIFFFLLRLETVDFGGSFTRGLEMWRSLFIDKHGVAQYSRKLDNFSITISKKKDLF